MEKQTLSLHVNGSPHQVEIGPKTTLLEVLRDDVGWGAVARQVKTPLVGLKVVPYYGCTLTRPQEVAIDSVENPTVLQELMQALGAEMVFMQELARAGKTAQGRFIARKRG